MIARRAQRIGGLRSHASDPFQVIGVLEGINKRHGEFTNEDVDILSVIASQAAVAINNARMVASLQAAYQELSQIERLKTDFGYHIVEITSRT